MSFCHPRHMSDKLTSLIPRKTCFAPIRSCRSFRFDGKVDGSQTFFVVFLAAGYGAHLQDTVNFILSPDIFHREPLLYLPLFLINQICGKELKLFSPTATSTARLCAACQSFVLSYQNIPLALGRLKLNTIIIF